MQECQRCRSIRCGYSNIYRSHRCHLCERQNDERLASIAPDKRPEKSGETSGGKTLRVGSVLFVSYMKPIPTAHIAYVR
jgi:hypothetical protein